MAEMGCPEVPERDPQQKGRPVIPVARQLFFDPAAAGAGQPLAVADLLDAA